MLTSDLTISAGEMFTQALLSRTPRPVRIGAATQGVFSDTLNRTLPNGWRFQLPNEEFRTLGVAYDGRGVPPDVRVPVFTDDQLDRHLDPALDRARELVIP